MLLRIMKYRYGENICRELVSSIGISPRRLLKQIDTGKYKPFYESLHTLLTEVVPNESEAEIVRLELAEMVRNTIQQYATKLKVDGIEQKELNSDLDLIQKFVSSIKTTTELTENMRVQTMQSIEDTRQTVKVAYESGGGER